MRERERECVWIWQRRARRGRAEHLKKKMAERPKRGLARALDLFAHRRFRDLRNPIDGYEDPGGPFIIIPVAQMGS